jgi:Arc/MetJ-type ribon-helix-helix transcriptional regulator
MYTSLMYIVDCDVLMNRTQVYLTDDEQKALRALVKHTGRSQSELIRAAVDHFIEMSQQEHRGAVLREAAGLWAGSADRSDFSALRAEFDRIEPGEG